MPRLLLIGGGHAHMHVIDQLHHHPIDDWQVTLISAHPYMYYSGMIAGYVEGIYDENEVRVNLDAMCRRRRIEFKVATVVFVEPREKYILTDEHQRIAFDIISFNIGSLTAGDELLNNSIGKWKIKPLHHVKEFVKTLDDEQQYVVVGGGPSAVELSLALHARFAKVGKSVKITMIHKQPILNSWGKERSAYIRKMLIDKGFTLIEDEEVIAVDAECVHTHQARQVAYHQLLWLTGPRAHPLFRRSGLPVDEHGYLRVNESLQVDEFPYIFGAGDCVHMSGDFIVPKAGVFAVRQAKYLYRNIAHTIHKEYLETYKPQKTYVAILSLGEKKGLFMRGTWTLSGKWVWKLKHLIDTLHMKKYIR
jgi:NADH dehydrogenase FAD-containing subunit